MAFSESQIASMKETFDQALKEHAAYSDWFTQVQSAWSLIVGGYSETDLTWDSYVAQFQADYTAKRDAFNVLAAQTDASAQGITNA